MYAYIQLKRLKRVAASVLIFAILFIMCSFISGAGRNGKEQIRLPILMYHSLLKDEKMQGTYVISPADFERDMKYLKDKGYTSVTFKELVEYTENGTPLPQKPIMITFDDGYYNNYLYAMPVLEKYGFTAVISPIVKFTEDYSKSGDKSPVYGCCSWKELSEMINSGAFTVENHTYNLHYLKERKGASSISGESYEEYLKTAGEDIKKAQSLIKENLGYTPLCFTYPYGAFDENSQRFVKESGFSASMTCTEKLNTITRDKESLFGLGRYIVTPENSAQEVLKKCGLEK